jgi:Ca2+-binding EF-hand superfamily protein
MYDDDEGGTIGYDNLAKAAEDLGMDLSKEEILEMLKFADRKSIGEVDMEDFMYVMLQGGLYE